MDELISDIGSKYLAVIFGTVLLVYIIARIARKNQYGTSTKFAASVAIAVVSFVCMYLITPYEFSDEAIKLGDAGALTELLRRTALGGYYGEKPITGIALTLAKYATALGALIWLPTFLWFSRWKKTDDGALL